MKEELEERITFLREFLQEKYISTTIRSEREASLTRLEILYRDLTGFDFV